VQRAVDTGRAVGDLSRPLPGVVDELLRRLPGALGADDEDRGIRGDERDGLELIDGEGRGRPKSLSASGMIEMEDSASSNV
jgi:hypothetical protein